MLINETHLQNSKIGRVLVALGRDEQPQNKRMIKGLVSKWGRAILQISSSYRKLGSFEYERESEVLRRKSDLGHHDPMKLIKTQRAKIPAPATFDYVIRPQAKRHDDLDDDDGIAGDQAMEVADRRPRGMAKSEEVGRDTRVAAAFVCVLWRADRERGRVLEVL